MKRNLLISCLYTVITAIVLGLLYPLAITGLARLAFPAKADGQLLFRNGTLAGSRLLGQPFTGPTYFHSRPSAAGTGYDATSSSGSNLAPTSKALIQRVDASTSALGTARPIPIDLVTTSASGLDPDITPAAALYQVPTIAAQRHLSLATVQNLVASRIKPRQFGLLGEPTVNVLSLNLALDRLTQTPPK